MRLLEISWFVHDRDTCSGIMEIFVGLAFLLPLSALAIQAREAENDDSHCDFL